MTRPLLAAALGLSTLAAPCAPGERAAERGTGADAAAPAAIRPAPDEATLVRRVDSLVRAREAADSFSGAVLLVKDGRRVYERTAGRADRATGASNRLDTRFNLGSVDKYFTRIAIRQLQRDGRLSMDDTLGRYVPDYPVARARSITVRQLYEMRAGIPDIFNERWPAARLGLRTTDDFIRLFADRPLLFEPGTREQYCNGCYVLLGKVVEVASGLSWYDYASRHVFAPAGMAGTGYFELGAATPNLAAGYTTRPPAPGSDAPLAGPDGRRANTFTLGRRGGSVGGGYSTAEDLLRLADAVRSARLLGPAWTDSLLGPRFLAPGPGRVGRSGWNGGFAGVNTAFGIRADGWTVIVLSNYDPPAATSIAEQIHRWIGS